MRGYTNIQLYKTNEKYKENSSSHSHQGLYNYTYFFITYYFLNIKYMIAYSFYPQLPSEFYNDSETLVHLINRIFFFY